MTSKLEFNKMQSEEINLIFQSLVDELNSFNDLRNLLLTLHTRIEFYLEKILFSYFFIEDDNKRINFIKIIQEFTFNKKFEIAKSLNLLDDSLKLKISEVNKIRNLCVHYIDYLNRIQSLSGLSINFLELNTIKIESAKILVELNEALAKNGG
ncbi:MAG: hypothetical protein AB1668_04575 [Nanoarchaeota archaeon]